MANEKTHTLEQRIETFLTEHYYVKRLVEHLKAWKNEGRSFKRVNSQMGWNATLAKRIGGINHVDRMLTGLLCFNLLHSDGILCCIIIPSDDNKTVEFSVAVKNKRNVRISIDI